MGFKNNSNQHIEAGTVNDKTDKYICIFDLFPKYSHILEVVFFLGYEFYQSHLLTLSLLTEWFW